MQQHASVPWTRAGKYQRNHLTFSLLLRPCRRRHPRLLLPKDSEIRTVMRNLPLPNRGHLAQMKASIPFQRRTFFLASRLALASAFFSSLESFFS